MNSAASVVADRPRIDSTQPSHKSAKKPVLPLDVALEVLEHDSGHPRLLGIMRDPQPRPTEVRVHINYAGEMPFEEGFTYVGNAMKIGPPKAPLLVFSLVGLKEDRQQPSFTASLLVRELFAKAERPCSQRFETPVGDERWFMVDGLDPTKSLILELESAERSRERARRSKRPATSADSAEPPPMAMTLGRLSNHLLAEASVDSTRVRAVTYVQLREALKHTAAFDKETPVCPWRDNPSSSDDKRQVLSLSDTVVDKKEDGDPTYVFFATCRNPDSKEVTTHRLELPVSLVRANNFDTLIIRWHEHTLAPKTALWGGGPGEVVEVTKRGELLCRAKGKKRTVLQLIAAEEGVAKLLAA